MTLRWSSWKSYKMMRCRRKWGLGTKSCVHSRGIDSVGVVYPVFPLGGVLLQWKIAFQFEFIQSIVRRQKIICGSKMYLYFCSLLTNWFVNSTGMSWSPSSGGQCDPCQLSFPSPLPLLCLSSSLPLYFPLFSFYFFSCPKPNVSPTVLTEYFWFN